MDTIVFILGYGSQAVVALMAGFLTYFVVKMIWYRTKEIKSQLRSDRAKRYLDEISKAVADAVKHTMQTYVDALKKSKTFTIENQKEALRRAARKAEDLLTSDALIFIGMAYEDVSKHLEDKIEICINEMK